MSLRYICSWSLLLDYNNTGINDRATTTAPATTAPVPRTPIAIITLIGELELELSHFIFDLGAFL